MCRHRKLIACTLVLAGLFTAPVSAQPRPPGYLEAETYFNSGATVEQRLRFQVMLVAAGYWKAVPNENFNLRLFKAIQRFQSENGLTADGMPGKAELDRLDQVAAKMLEIWGFRKVKHPQRRVSIWVPFGLGLKATRNEHGLGYSDPQRRLRIDFTTVPNMDLERNFGALVNAHISDGATIHYKVIKDGWFVISATGRDGVDRYLRYHQDGANVSGFTLFWNNANGNVSGERIAVLMSASLWSDMTGAAFIDPPTSDPKVATRSVPAPTTTPPPAQEAVAKPAQTTVPTPKADAKVSTGTGFFVAQDGSFVTNAHVVEGCSLVRVKTDDGSILDAGIVARDTANDLALLRVTKASTKVAKLRIGVRLGESIAAFGYPHTDILSTSGNFTLGNITALSGMDDDSRHFQISAPVQSGNSGGPLLDQSGNVVGVVMGKLNALKVAMRDGDLPQNVNFAVKSAILATFLDANRVSFQAGAGPTKSLDAADLADLAKSLSGFVACKP